MSVTANYHILIIQDIKMSTCIVICVFNMSSTLCEINCCSDTLCGKSLLILQNAVVHPNISSQIYIFTIFLVHLAVQFLYGGKTCGIKCNIVSCLNFSFLQFLKKLSSFRSYSEWQFTSYILFESLSPNKKCM